MGEGSLDDSSFWLQAFLSGATTSKTPTFWALAIKDQSLRALLSLVHASENEG